MPQRHRLVWLNHAGWREARAAAWDAQAQTLLGWWSGQDWPLVVTRQPDPARLALGLPAPLAFDRRRLAFSVSHAAVRRQGAFPPAHAIVLADPLQQQLWRALCATLATRGCAARVYGAHGWQALTGLHHVHAGSDVDLLLPVADAALADAVCAALAGADGAALPRLDGELIFPDGAGVAWREWWQWRLRPAAGAQQLLVKRLAGAALECPAGASFGLASFGPASFALASTGRVAGAAAASASEAVAAQGIAC